MAAESGLSVAYDIIAMRTEIYQHKCSLVTYLVHWDYLELLENVVEFKKEVRFSTKHKEVPPCYTWEIVQKLSDKNFTQWLL